MPEPTNPLFAPAADLAPGDLVRLDAPAGFLVALVRDVHEFGGTVQLTVALHLPAEELIDIIWAQAAPAEEVGA